MGDRRMADVVGAQVLAPRLVDANLLRSRAECTAVVVLAKDEALLGAGIV